MQYDAGMRVGWLMVVLLIGVGCRHDGNRSDFGSEEIQDLSATFTTFDLGGDAGELMSGALVVAPALLSFGHVKVGNTATGVVHVANAGADALTIDGASVTGPAFYVDSSALPLTLAAGMASTLTVTFAPTTHAVEMGSLALSSSAASMPLVVALAGDSSYEVDLSWDAPDMSADAVVGYNVYRGTTSGGPYPTKLNTTPVPGTTYVDTTVQPCMDYFYVTTSVDAQGNESAYSNQFEADIPCS